MSKKETVKNSGTNLVHAVAVQDLDIDVTFKRATQASFSTAVRALTKNWQQGTVACKGRSDVSRTNRKPWKQKGTGRARAGSARSPLWRGGGTVFGPQARVRTLKMTKKLKRKVLSTLLVDCLDKKNIMYADWAFEGEKPKTSIAQDFLNKSGLARKKIALFVDPHDALTAASFANIPNVHPLSFDQVNAYDLANSDCWLFLKKDFDHFNKMVAQWI